MLGFCQSPVLAHWTVHALAECTEIVLPDGCRDLVLRFDAGAAPTATVSSLQRGPRPVILPAGCVLFGFRLQPGISVNSAALLREARQRDCDPERMSELLDAHTSRDANLAELLACIAAEPLDLAAVCRHLGVGLRQLQRLCRTHGQPTPQFWLRLAPALLSQLALSGYGGGETGEQISTRYPSGSMM